MYPKQHRFIGPKSRLNQRYVTLAEAMREAGFYSAAWTANGNVSTFWGFAQGWHSFRNTLHKGGGLSGKDLANHAIRFLDEHGQNRFICTLERSTHTYLGEASSRGCHATIRHRTEVGTRRTCVAETGISSRDAQHPFPHEIVGEFSRFTTVPFRSTINSSGGYWRLWRKRESETVR